MATISVWSTIVLLWKARKWFHINNAAQPFNFCSMYSTWIRTLHIWQELYSLFPRNNELDEIQALDFVIQSCNVKRAFILDEAGSCSVLLGPFVKIKLSYLICCHFSRLNDFVSNQFFSLQNMLKFSINHTTLMVVTKLFLDENKMVRFFMYWFSTKRCML